MKPYYQDKWVTIYHGDCREVLPRIETGVDIILTSPPYNVGLAYGESFDDKAAEGEFRQAMADWVSLAFGLANDSSRFYVAVGERMLWWFKEMAEGIGWTYAQLLVWCKPNVVTARKISGDWGYMTDWFLEFRKGPRTPMLNKIQGLTTFNWFRYAYPQSNFNHLDKKVHPAQWPAQLPRHILGRTPGSVVLDPFMGSGSVLEAAKRLNRYSIGIEIEERYCEIAANRCRQEVMDFSVSRPIEEIG